MNDNFLENSEYRTNIGNKSNNIRNPNNRMSPSMVSSNHINNSSNNINNNSNNNNNNSNIGGKVFSIDSPPSPNISNNNNNNNINNINNISNNNNTNIISPNSSSYNNNNVYNNSINFNSVNSNVNNSNGSLNSSSNSLNNINGSSGLSTSGNIIINSNNNNNNNNNNDNNNKVTNASMDDEYDIPMMMSSAKYGYPSSAFDNYIVKDRQCSSYADRVLFSNKYYYSYVFMIIINLILVIWLITNLVKKNTSVPSHWMFITLDILVNIALFFEISLQMVSQKKKYFQTLSNLFDLFVLVVSIAGLFVYFFHSATSNNYDYEGIIIILITSIRYGFQFLRLLALIKRQKLKKSTFNSRIDFTELRETDIDFDIDSNDDF